MKNNEKGEMVISPQAKKMDAAILTVTNMQDRLDIAAQMIESGLVPKSFTTPEAVVSAVEMGSELGLKPYVALNNVFVIQGRPTLSTASMIALVQSKGVAIKVTEDFKAFSTDSGAEDIKTSVTVYRKIKELDRVMEYTHSKTWNECVLAGWTEKDNWAKLPKNMLRARTISEALRLYCSDLLQGIYSTEELMDSMNVDYIIDEDDNIKI